MAWRSRVADGGLDPPSPARAIGSLPGSGASAATIKAPAARSRAGRAPATRPASHRQPIAPPDGAGAPAGTDRDRSRRRPRRTRRRRRSSTTRASRRRSELAAAPREDLVEKSRYGLLPRIGEDGTRPLRPMRGRPTSAPAMKRVAIVIGGIGIAERRHRPRRSTTSPASVTLAFAPYAETCRARSPGRAQAGHEILLQIPLEPSTIPRSIPVRTP